MDSVGRVIRGEHAPILRDTVGENNHAGQDLDLQLLYQPWDVLYEDAEEPRVIVLRCEFLRVKNTDQVMQRVAEGKGMRTARCLSMIAHRLKLEW